MSLLQLNRPAVADITKQIKRLCAAFGRPFKADMDAMAEEWHRGLANRFARDVVEAAVDRCCDNDPEFPKLARLRSHCFDIEKERQPARQKGLKEQYQEWEVRPRDPDTPPGQVIYTPCPVCGSCMECTPRGFLMVHDDAAHTERHISYSNFGNPEWRHLSRLEEPKRVPLSQRVAGNPAAKPLPTVADVLPKTAPTPRKPLDPEVERMRTAIPATTQRLWEEPPLVPPPDAVVSR